MKMRSSQFSSFSYHHRNILVSITIPFLLFILAASTAAAAAATPSPISQSRHNNNNMMTLMRVGRRQNSCHPISAAQLPPAIRLHLQRLRHCGPPFPPPPPPPPDDDEIDPRYGVEKRLVPSGPNPLHN
ncbi:hypothetical protein ABFS83_12G093800 [Erythranthe nasuta]